MRYRDYEHLVRPARRKSELWRLAVGLVLIVVIYLIGLMVFLPLAVGFSGLPETVAQVALNDADTPYWTAILLFSFVFMAMPVFLVTETLHSRRWKSLFSPLRVEIRVFLLVTLFLLVVNLSLFLLPPWDFGLLQSNPALSPPKWLLLLPLTLIGVLIQTGAEEILFRGYLQSQLAARFRSPFVWMLLPSLLFGVLHYDTEIWGAGALWPALWAVVFGIFAADLVARTGTLGAAVAFHFVNNLIAVAFVGFPNELGGLSLFHVPVTTVEMAEQSPGMPADFLIVLISWLTARIALRR